jgi:hypothetical protein
MMMDTLEYNLKMFDRILNTGDQVSPHPADAQDDDRQVWMHLDDDAKIDLALDYMDELASVNKTAALALWMEAIRQEDTKLDIINHIGRDFVRANADEWVYE